MVRARLDGTLSIVFLQILLASSAHTGMKARIHSWVQETGRYVVLIGRYVPGYRLQVSVCACVQWESLVVSATRNKQSAQPLGRDTGGAAC